MAVGEGEGGGVPAICSNPSTLVYREVHVSRWMTVPLLSTTVRVTTVLYPSVGYSARYVFWPAGRDGTYWVPSVALTTLLLTPPEKVVVRPMGKLHSSTVITRVLRPVHQLRITIGLSVSFVQRMSSVWVPFE